MVSQSPLGRSPCEMVQHQRGQSSSPGVIFTVSFFFLAKNYQLGKPGPPVEVKKCRLWVKVTHGLVHYPAGVNRLIWRRKLGAIRWSRPLLVECCKCVDIGRNPMAVASPDVSASFSNASGCQVGVNWGDTRVSLLQALSVSEGLRRRTWDKGYGFKSVATFHTCLLSGIACLSDFQDRVGPILNKRT